MHLIVAKKNSSTCVNVVLTCTIIELHIKWQNISEGIWPLCVHNSHHSIYMNCCHTSRANISNGDEFKIFYISMLEIVFLILLSINSK